jgi:hypothetical protein
MMGGLIRTVLDAAPRAWPLWAGCAAALLGTALLLGPAARWQAQADESVLAASRARAGVAIGPAATSPAGAQQPALLPAADRSPDRSARLAQLARRHGVQVQRLREQWDGLGQLQLSLSGTASYLTWRSFIAAALAADPALALDRLRLQRPDPETADLGAETQWTFLHRGAAPVQAARPAAARSNPGAAP